VKIKNSKGIRNDENKRSGIREEKGKT